MEKIEQKRIGYATYLKKGNIVIQIKGPYRPGSVWLVNAYRTKPEFDQAWKEGKVTSVERGLMNQKTDQVVSALSFGHTGAIASNLFTEETCLGYRFASKKESIEVGTKFIEAPKF